MFLLERVKELNKSNLSISGLPYILIFVCSSVVVLLIKNQFKEKEKKNKKKRAKRITKKQELNNTIGTTTEDQEFKLFFTGDIK